MPSKYPIYCINLEHRKDRKEHSIRQFTNLGISLNSVIYPYLKKIQGVVYTVVLIRILKSGMTFL